MAIAGTVVRIVHCYLDGVSDPELPLTGQAANFSFELQRDNGTTFVHSTELVSAVETATVGYYALYFTPESGGLYTLFAQETAGGKRRPRWDFQVYPAGAIFTPTFSNAFCAQSDVERWSGIPFGSTSKPTPDQVAGFAQARASEMRSILLAAGWPVSPGDVALAQAETDMLRECNAEGAAADAWRSKYRDSEPAISKHADDLLQEYQTRLDRLVKYGESTKGRSGIGSPMTQGEVTLAAEAPITDDGLRHAVRWDQEF